MSEAERQAENQTLLKSKGEPEGQKEISHAEPPEGALIPEIEKDLPPRCKRVTLEGGVELDDNEDRALWETKMNKATGTADKAVRGERIAQAAVISAFSKSDTSLTENVNLTLAMLYGIRPQDEVEGMLAVQLIATHSLSVEFLRRAVMEGQTPEAVTQNVNQAIKLPRTYTAQVETLGKYRNKGKQKVTVEHVHVNAGGQAIVGIVDRKRREGGDSGGKLNKDPMQTANAERRPGRRLPVKTGACLMPGAGCTAGRALDLVHRRGCNG